MRLVLPALVRQFLLATALTILALSVNAEDYRPDTSRVLRLVGRWSVAHACPVWPDTILTAAHVIEARPLDLSVPIPYRYQDYSGHWGVVVPTKAERCSDLGFMSVKGTELGWYVRSDKEPQAGEKVWLVGYDWSSKGKAFTEKLVEAKVVRVIAGHLLLDKSGEPGSSGSCVFNGRNEVVAINAAGLPIGGSEAGWVVGVWGEWIGVCQ